MSGGLRRGGNRPFVNLPTGAGQDENVEAEDVEADRTRSFARAGGPPDRRVDISAKPGRTPVTATNERAERIRKLNSQNARIREMNKRLRRGGASRPSRHAFPSGATAC